MKTMVLALFLLSGNLALAADVEFSPPVRSPLPKVNQPNWARTPIDAFILFQLEELAIQPSDMAEKRRLVRRLTQSLIGLPPTRDEEDSYLKDPSANAYEKVVDRLLSSPRFGEKWGGHWLDLARYADSDGYNRDQIRPTSYLYRDFVIRALNENMPYDRFLSWQIAGDEIDPKNPAAQVATGFLRMGPYEHNAANLQQKRQDYLDEITDVTTSVVLGLTIGCARCHDHKFDPTSQKDYFSFQAFFASWNPKDNFLAVSPTQVGAYKSQVANWEKEKQPLREEMEKLTSGQVKKLTEKGLVRFGQEIQESVLTLPSQRTPKQKQIAHLAELQIKDYQGMVAQEMKGDAKKKYDQLMGEMNAGKPKAPPAALTMADLGNEAPDTFVLAGGDWRKPGEKAGPAVPKFLAGESLSIQPRPESTGRRSALASWLTSNKNPLTAKVMVNRIWQHHFGVGLVASSSDFGALGDPATHPELLNWLAVELIESGWDLKHLHRLMVTSSVFMQDSQVDPANAKHQWALQEDRENKLLWHFRRTRSQAEHVRDQVLFLTGSLDQQLYGPAVMPPLPEGVPAKGWKVSDSKADHNRRSIYVLMKRNLKFPLFDLFDSPDLHNSCSRRLATTTAPQALALLNGEFTRERSAAWANNLSGRHDGKSKSQVEEAMSLAWSRQPTPSEVATAVKFLDEQAALYPGNGKATKALADFCLVLLNSSEFLFVD